MVRGVGARAEVVFFVVVTVVGLVLFIDVSNIMALTLKKSYMGVDKPRPKPSSKMSKRLWRKGAEHAIAAQIIRKCGALGDAGRGKGDNSTSASSRVLVEGAEASAPAEPEAAMEAATPATPVEPVAVQPVAVQAVGGQGNPAAAKVEEAGLDSNPAAAKVDAAGAISKASVSDVRVEAAPPLDLWRDVSITWANASAATLNFLGGRPQAVSTVIPPPMAADPEQRLEESDILI